MPVTAPNDDQVARFRELLKVGRLRAMSARDLLVSAARFERAEREFSERDFGERRLLKISILASLSSQHLASILKLFLYAEGFLPSVHIGQYDAVVSGVLAPNAEIYGFQPDIIVMLPSTEDIKHWPAMFADHAEVERWVEKHTELYVSLWNAVALRLPACRIYHGLFVQSLERPFGNLEAVYEFSQTRCLQRLNHALVSRRTRNVVPCDLDAVSALVGREHWYDEGAFFLSKQPVSLRQLPVVCALIARLIAVGAGKVKKCLVLDLDNTLWGGVIGDDGVDGIRLDPADATGEAFLRFQRYLLTLKKRGVLLAACSKNDDAVARSPFLQNSNMVLKLDDFAAFVANWDDKVKNVRRIAEVLNIDTDSLVFFDDNPAEREIVEKFQPDVLVIDVPAAPEHFVRALDLSFAFEWQQLTAEDLTRADTFAQDRQRQELATRFVDYDDYLRSLDMKAQIALLDEASVPRVAQLFEKTNQFNLRPPRYSQAELEMRARDPNGGVLSVRFSDKFSSYGVMSAVVLRRVGRAMFVDNWVMSCRVFERGLDAATFDAILAFARATGADEVLGEYCATAKNGYVKELFLRLGFKKAPPDRKGPNGTGGDLYSFDVSVNQNRRHFIDTRFDLAGGDPEGRGASSETHPSSERTQ